MKYAAALRLVPVNPDTGEAEADRPVVRLMAEIEASTPMGAVASARDTLHQAFNDWLDEQLKLN